MKVFLLSILFTISTLCFSQDQINVKNLNPDHEYENVLTKTLYSDSKSTYFIIWIKKMLNLINMKNIPNLLS